MSKNYIDILLKLHEQYPDAIVGAQASEIRNIPRDAELDEVGVTLKQGGIDDTRPGRWRWLGYLLPKAVYEATLEEMNEYMEFIGPSYRNIPHEAVRVKYGVMVTGFDGVMDKICDQHGIRRIATVVPRAKYIGEKGLFGNPRLYEAMGFAHNLRYEFDEVEKFKVRDGMAEMPKNKIFDYVLDRYCESPVRVLEIGRMRNTAPFSEASDGWSTLQFARNSKVEVLYSVDNDPKTLKVCEQYPELADGKVVFAERVEDLRWDQVDLLYLDAENSANATVGHYESMKGGLIDSAVILIDDVYSPDGNKGNLIIPLLEKEGYMIEKIYPMALARKV